MSSRRRFSVASLSILALLAFGGPATAMADASAGNARSSAAPAKGTYEGKIEKGGRVKFRLDGKRVTRINGLVPTLCLEFGGSYDTRFGLEYFNPPGAFILGRSREAKASQPLALATGSKSTKHYTVTLKTAGSNRVKGRLKLWYTFLTYGYPYYAYMWQCSSKVDFTARRR